MLPKTEFLRILILDEDLLFLCLEHGVRIERPKMSVFRSILTYSDLENHTVKIYSDLSINHDDIIDILLEEGKEDEQIMPLILKIQKDWNLGKLVENNVFRKYCIPCNNGA